MINIIMIDSLRNLSINASNGFSLIFYYVLAYVFFLIPCALIIAELASHYPKTGGVYVWMREAFSKRIALTAVWLHWIYSVLWYPTILAFIAVNTAYLIDPGLADSKIYMVSMVIGFFTIATALNIFGMKISALISTVSAIVGTIIPTLLLIGLGVFWLADNKPIAVDTSLAHWFPKNFDRNNLAFLVIVLFSVFGLEVSAVHAGSVKNPRKNYPRALLASALFIVLSLVFSSLAIAIVVPSDTLSLIGGLDQAFKIFLSTMHLSFLFPLIIASIVIGSFGNMAAWAIGPTKELMVAAEDGLLPNFFKKTNRFNSPFVILGLQAIIIFLLCGFFVAIKSFNTSYWILSDLSAQLGALFYLFFFAIGIKLHKRIVKKADCFRLSNWAMKLCCITGFSTCFIIFLLGFIPPELVKMTSLLNYEAILIGGILLFTLIPTLLLKWKISD